jgi:DNA-binding HxlR family transcriptional regulator
MGSSANQGYCAFTKAVEHLGDRWSFLIVRELAMFGPQGFNTLAAGLPGRVSRSVLAARLRKLEELGLVARGSASSRGEPYRLAPAGARLVPTLKSLWDWAEHWVPEDPAIAERDPSVIGAWLESRVDPSMAPERQVAIELAFQGIGGDRLWLLVSRGVQASICLEDPLLDSERYVYVETDAAALFPIARGLRSWGDAMRDGSVRVYGDPALVGALPAWFAPSESDTDASRPTAEAVA